ncbi:MAG: S-layer homology domain-containing protein [Acidimicrobiia bacterium]|nr:S-layer homology domain-containing protein [Acidimicrobiia bacterium]
MPRSIPLRAVPTALLALVLVIVMAAGSAAGGLPPGGTFTDDNGNAHEGFIEAIAAGGITSGCGGTRYCPDDDVTRGQMASFLARALNLPDSVTDWFSDDDTSTHQVNINKIAEAGITLGFGDGTFAPDEVVARDQMASFLARAITDLIPSTTDYFSDDAGNAHEANINVMAENAITLGCDSSGTIYCPTDPVRRDQMASFLGRALGLEEMIPPPLPEGEPTDIIQAAYVVPADVAPIAGRDAAIANEIEEVQGWYDTQTDGVHPVFAKDSSGVAVAVVVLPDTLSELSGLTSPETPIVDHIRTVLPDTADRDLVVVMEGNLGTGYCGRTGSIVFIPIGNCGIDVSETSVWPYGGTYLMGHELTHLLGAVPGCAPNSDGTGHVSDDKRDILYSGIDGRDWDNLMLDPGNDDYYDHGRSDCTDLADSPLLGSY